MEYKIYLQEQFSFSLAPASVQSSESKCLIAARMYGKYLCVKYGKHLHSINPHCDVSIQNAVFKISLYTTFFTQKQSTPLT